MSDRIFLEKEKMPAENSAEAGVKNEYGAAACPVQGKGWLKGPFGIAICCGAPLLLIAVISFFGFSLGAIASGALGFVALVACPVGIFLMMRTMMKNKKKDQTLRQ